MHRIDQPTAVGTLPTPAAAGTPGYFSNATPGSGTPTIVDNDWCNDIQEELIAILTAASVSPSKTTHNQILTALTALFATTATKAVPGKLVTASGIIIQWGVAGVTGSQAITFPTTFPNAFLQAWCCENAADAWSSSTASIEGIGSTPSTSGMTLYSRSISSGSVTNTSNISVSWFAIGY